MRVTGYRLKGYDATYEKTVFDVETHLTEDSCVLDITELNSGMCFILDLNDEQSKYIKKTIK